MACLVSTFFFVVGGFAHLAQLLADISTWRCESKCGFGSEQ